MLFVFTVGFRFDLNLLYSKPTTSRNCEALALKNVLRLGSLLRTIPRWKLILKKTVVRGRWQCFELVIEEWWWTKVLTIIRSTTCCWHMQNKYES